MQRGDTQTTFSPFVPKLKSICGVGYCSPRGRHNTSDISTSEKNDLFSTTAEKRCRRLSAPAGVRKNKNSPNQRNNNNNNNIIINNSSSSRYINSNNNTVLMAANDQSSPTPRRNSTNFATGVLRQNGVNSAYDSRIFKGHISDNSNYNSNNNNNTYEINCNGWGAKSKWDNNVIFAANVDKRKERKNIFETAGTAQIWQRDCNKNRNNVDLCDGSMESSFCSSLSRDTTVSFQESAVCDIDTEPVVPVGVLLSLPSSSSPSSRSQVFSWMLHPRQTIILSLLKSRGIFLREHQSLVEYHMSDAFLNHIDLCCQGSYFVCYTANSLPKERFYSIRMLPRDLKERLSEKVPYLTWTLHCFGVQMIGRVPLEQLVGVTKGTRSSASFAPHMVVKNMIIGPQINNHRIRMPTNGAFSLWFCDRCANTTMSLDLITCNSTVFDVWTRTFKGLVSVNSSSVAQVPMTGEGASVELMELTRNAQLRVQEDANEK